jgi:hypothetical protein
MRSPFSTAIAIAVGLVLLLSTFLPIELLRNLRTVLLNLAIVLAGVAGVLAILNLVGVHWRRFRAPRRADGYSLIFLIAFALTFLGAVILGPSNAIVQKVVTSIQFPVEASLMAVAGISLAYAATRLFRRRKSWMAVIFLMSTLVFLVLASGFLSAFSELPLIGALLDAIHRLPIAGARGILLGVALGSLLTGLRVLIGADRPYTG